MSAAAELQRAVVAALKGDSGLAALVADRVFDHTPATAAFPYVTLGRLTSYDWSTATERGSEHLVTLHAWSQGNGKRQALALMARADAALHDRPLVLDGYALVNLRLEMTELAYDDAQGAYRGTMRLRAVVEG